MNDLLSLVIPFLFFVALVAGFYKSLPYILTYRLTAEALEVRNFGFTCLRLRYGDIASVSLVPLKETFGCGFFTYRLGTRFRGPVLRIDAKTGLRKVILLTPDDPEKFFEELKKLAQL